MRSLYSRVVMGLGVAAAASVLPASQATAGISISAASSVNAYAGNTEVGTTATDNPSGIPYNKTTTATDEVAGTSAVQFVLSNTSFASAFTANVADPFSFANGQVQLVFTPSTDLAYNLSGSYSETGASSFHSLFVDLSDLTTKTPLFDNLQSSASVTNETLTLGNQAGTDSNSLSGSLTGTLLADHQYSLSIATETDGMPQLTFALGEITPFSFVPLGTGANGSVSLGLAPTAIPLPPAAWMGLATLAGIGALLKLRRNARAA